LRGRRFVGDRAFEGFAYVGQLVDFGVQAAEESAAASRRRRDEVFKNGKLRQGFAEGYKFAWTRVAERDAAGQSLEVLNAAQFLANFAADDRLLDQMGHGVEACLDGRAIDERAKNPEAQEAAPMPVTVTSSAATKWLDIFAGVVGKNRIEQFEIADRNWVEDQRVVLFVVADAIEVTKGSRAGGRSLRHCPKFLHLLFCQGL